jgi:DNA-binding response OmpR family regulator
MKKLLIVDDESTMVKLLKLYLEPNGYNCETASSGAEAIKYIMEISFDLVLMDVMMPEKSGWETVREIRKFSNIPILMLTARDQYSDIVKSLHFGANGHITKPIDENLLLYHIDNLTKDDGPFYPLPLDTDEKALLNI